MLVQPRHDTAPLLFLVTCAKSKRIGINFTVSSYRATLRALTLHDSLIVQ